ncbi:MAG: SurA N-terminal domain-containing protein [Bacillota bacterium]
MFNTLREHSKIVVIIVAVAFVATGALMGFGSYLNNGMGGDGGQQGNQNIASVNDEDISQREFLNVLQNQASQVSNLSGSQLLDFRLSILNSIIERKLILQKAEEMGISVEVSEEEVQNTIDEILDNYDMTEDELVSNLESQGYDMDDFKKDLRNDIRQNNIVDKTRETTYDNINVSEEEIKEEFEALKEEESEDIEYEEEKEDIENKLLQQKQDEAFNNWLDDVKSESDITIYDPVLRGVNAYQEEQYDVAIENFNEVFENSESPGEGVYIYLAKSYHAKEDTEKAIEIFDEGMEEYSTSWDLHLNLADLYVDMEENEKAIEHYDEASELVSENYVAHYQLYMGYTEAGAPEKAEEQMQKIQELSMQQQMGGDQQQQQVPRTEEQQSDEIPDNTEEMDEDINENDINNEIDNDE